MASSAGGSFCCNYAAGPCIYGNYASDNVCWIFAGFQVLLSATGMLVDLFVTIMQVTVSVAVMQLEVSAAHMWVTTFYCNYADGSLCCNDVRWYFLQCIMRMTVSIVIMQMTFPYSFIGDTFK